jgi:hypothetical protein
MNAGRLEDSKAVLESLILLNEDYPWARINLARVHLLASDPAAALQIVSASDPDLWRDYVYILANHDLGRQSRAQRMTDDFIATYGADAAIITAEILAWRGFVDDAFTWLDTAVERRNPGLIYIRDNPFFAGIRGDVRWQLLLDRLGLLDPPAWPAAGG